MKKIQSAAIIASAFLALASCSDPVYVPLPKEYNKLVGTHWKSTDKFDTGYEELEFIDHKNVRRTIDRYEEWNGETVHYYITDTCTYYLSGTKDMKKCSIGSEHDTFMAFYPHLEDRTMDAYYKKYDEEARKLFSPEYTYKQLPD